MCIRDRAGGAAYRKLQASLEEKDRQIELMLSQMPGGMAICLPDEDFTLDWISSSLCKLLGYAGPEDFFAATGGTCRSFILPEDYGEMARTVAKRFEGSDEYYAEYRICLRDGGVLWASDLGRRVTGSDGRTLIYCFISDITYRRERELEIERANREAARQARFLGQLYESIPCGILQFTPRAGTPHHQPQPCLLYTSLTRTEEDQKDFLEKRKARMLAEEEERVNKALRHIDVYKRQA